MTVVSSTYSSPGSGRTNSITPIAGTSNFDWNIGTLYNDEDRVLTVVATAKAVTALTRGTYTVSTTQTVSGTLGTKSPQDYTEDIAVYGSCIPAMSGTITGNNPICAGNSASLNLSNNIGAIQWQKSSDNASFTDIAGAIATNYTSPNLNSDTYYRTKVVFGSCINYATSVKVTVNPLPSLGAITGPNAINTDYTRLYSNTTSGGTWSCTNPAIATIDASGNLTGKRGGSTEITYSLTNSNGCSSSVTKTVNVIQTIRTALIKSGQLSTDSTIMTNRNGAKGFGTGRDFTGEIFSVPNTPKITTDTVSSITTTSAISGGSIISNGGRAIIARGVVWDTATAPTIALTTKTSDGSGNGTFTSNISGLAPSNTYYIRTYVTTSLGTTYGNEISFTTSSIP
jgi:hypothetical protein